MKKSIQHSFFNSTKPLIIGHRGSSGDRPENTMSAFNHALSSGADVLESDMQLSKDGQIVLIHDETIDRTTNGSGAVSDFTVKELKSFDAGHYFTLDEGKTYPFRGKGITIPTLDELLSKHKNVKLNLDLKSDNPLLIGKIIDTIIDHNMSDRVILASFNHNTMKRLRSHLEEKGLNVLTTNSKREAVLMTAAHKLRLPNYKKPMALEIPTKQSGITILTQKFLDKAKNMGHYVIPWVINDDKEIENLFHQGVDGIITDYPEKAHRIRKNMS
jgi:glycerophosphoryl diester phosphodiesterase